MVWGHPPEVLMLKNLTPVDWQGLEDKCNYYVAMVDDLGGLVSAHKLIAKQLHDTVISTPGCKELSLLCWQQLVGLQNSA